MTIIKIYKYLEYQIWHYLYFCVIIMAQQSRLKIQFSKYGIFTMFFDDYTIMALIHNYTFQGIILSGIMSS